MPDLTIIYTRTCPTNSYWSHRFRSSSGKYYTISYDERFGHMCTCPGFEYRNTCRHIQDENLTGLRCGWGLDAYMGEVHDETFCPECGAETIVISCGV